MKKKYFLIISPLLVSLFIYLFYRTEKTIATELFINVISFDNFKELQTSIRHLLPLHTYIIYSLPEGLWVFCITFTSKFLFIKISDKKINLVYIPLVFVIVLEIFQLIHLTNGRFDIWDIGFSIVFWALANYVFSSKENTQNIFKPFNLNSCICIASYLIVYLAHVWQ